MEVHGPFGGMTGMICIFLPFDGCTTLGNYPKEILLVHILILVGREYYNGFSLAFCHRTLTPQGRDLMGRFCKGCQSHLHLGTEEINHGMGEGRRVHVPVR